MKRGDQDPLHPPDTPTPSGSDTADVAFDSHSRAKYAINFIIYDDCDINFHLFSDLKPLYFLQHIAPERYELPAGVEIVYDEEYSTHAYHFTSRAATLSFPAAAILKYCAYFPEEYSLLVTLKVSKQTANRDETLFAVIPVGSTKVKMGLRLYRSKLYLDYSDPLRRRRKTAVFNQLRIFDQKWHTFVMSITADRISLRTDCGKKRTKRLVRTFPSMLSMEEDHIHIGNRKRGRKGYYTVSFAE